MAKYILPSVGRGIHKIPCAVIGENSLNECYTVKFGNGVIRNVPKSSVQDLDVIDEALIDNLKKGARKIGRAIKNIYNKIVYTGKAVYTAILGVAAPHLGNTMLAAEDENLDFLGFIPSDDVAKECEAVGIEPTQTVVEVEDEDICDDINNFWHEKMEDEPAKEPEGVAESKKSYPRKKLRDLYEANDNPDLKPVDGAKGHPIVDRDTACRYIAEQYDARYEGVKSEEAPILLWGAPGIGKTQIVMSLGKMLSEMYGGNVNVITINAMGFRKDSISLPGFEQKNQEFYGEDGKKFVIPVKVPKDFVKSWLPTYDPEMADEIVENSKRFGKDITRDEAIRILDNIANGGHPANPETDEPYLEGKGGIIFIDEVARISTEVLQVFMTFLQSRVLNGQVLGSRWIFVGASNRFTDLSDKLRRQIAWEAAWGDRFSQYNFVPKVEEWLEWGAEEVEINGEMRTRVDQDVLDYIKSNTDMYYSAASADLSLGDETARDRFPNPRSWMAYSDAKRNAERFSKKFNKPLKLKELKDKLQTQVGAKASANYFSWLNGPGKELTDEQAASVWEYGAEAVKHGVKLFDDEKKILGPYGVIMRIINNHPDIRIHIGDIEDASTGNVDRDELANNISNRRNLNLEGEKPREERDLTPEQFKNITDYLLACVKAADKAGSKTSTAASLAAAISNTLMSTIKRNFSDATYARMLNSTTNKAYMPGFRNIEAMKKWDI